MYLENKNCICYNVGRLKESISPCGRKKRTPEPCYRTVRGFFFSFTVAKHPLGYCLPLSFLSSHLQIRWQRLAATVTKKEIATSMKTPPPAAGYWLGNIEIISRISAAFHIYFTNLLVQRLSNGLSLRG